MALAIKMVDLSWIIPLGKSQVSHDTYELDPCLANGPAIAAAGRMAHIAAIAPQSGTGWQSIPRVAKIYSAKLCSR